MKSRNYPLFWVLGSGVFLGERFSTTGTKLADTFEFFGRGSLLTTLNLLLLMNIHFHNKINFSIKTFSKVHNTAIGKRQLNHFQFPFQSIAMSYMKDYVNMHNYQPADGCLVEFNLFFYLLFLTLQELGFDKEVMIFLLRTGYFSLLLPGLLFDDAFLVHSLLKLSIIIDLNSNIKILT